MRRAIVAASVAMLFGLAVVGASQLLRLAPALVAWQFGCHF